MLDAEKRTDSQEDEGRPSYRFQTITNRILDTHNSRLGFVLPTRRVHLLLSTLFSRLKSADEITKLASFWFIHSAVQAEPASTAMIYPKLRERWARSEVKVVSFSRTRLFSVSGSSISWGCPTKFGPCRCELVNYVATWLLCHVK